MKRIVLVSVAAVLLIIVVAATFCVINNTPTAKSADNPTSNFIDPISSNNQTVYVGVTYCGNSFRR
jgi:hypothetical protein